jgi:hypothetical protein
MYQKNLGKICFFEEMLTLFIYIETGISCKNIPSSPIRNKNTTLHRTVNASSCLHLSAFSIGGRIRRNVLRTGGCRGPVSPHAHFLSHFHCVCSLRFVAVCCSFFKPQLPSAIVRFLERLLPQVVVWYAFLD